MNFDDLTVTVERPGGTDRHGNPLPGTFHTVSGCTVTPRSSEERTDGQATVITGRSLFAPPGTDLEAQDVVVLSAAPREDDERWQVDGEPAAWDWFDGNGAGVVAVLTRAEG